MTNINRETKELKIGDHTLIVKTFLTGGEVCEIEDALLSKMEVNEGGKIEFAKLNGTALREQSHKTIQMVVVSIDGKTENIIEEIKDLPYKEYKEVTDYVDSIANVKKA